MIIRTEIEIAAPPAICFDLARDVNAHAASTTSTKERIVECPPRGVLGLGDEVEFEAIHLGVKQRLRSKVIEYERPRRFVDEMQRGAFKRLRHIHEFVPTDGGTLMVDVLDFASPLGLAGALIDWMFLGAYMRRFLIARNKELKKMAEAKVAALSPGESAGDAP